VWVFNVTPRPHNPREGDAVITVSRDCWVGQRDDLNRCGKCRSQSPVDWILKWDICVSEWSSVKREFWHSSALKMEDMPKRQEFYTSLSWRLNRASCSTVCKKTNKCSRKLWIFINTFHIFYPDMFGHMVAILRGSWVPDKLLKQCSCYGRVRIMTRPVWPVVVLYHTARPQSSANVLFLLVCLFICQLRWNYSPIRDQHEIFVFGFIAQILLKPMCGLKILCPEGWHEESSRLRSHKYWVLP
jgi:hypothetical protein